MSDEDKINPIRTGTFSIAMAPHYNLRVKKLDPTAKLPEKAHIGDLGYDLFALEDTVLQPGTVTKVRTGIACNFPYGYGALIRDRSSVATKQGVFVVAGVIDNAYTGEIIVAFYNPGHPELEKKYSWPANAKLACDVHMSGPTRFTAGQKIAQLILTPVVRAQVTEVEELTETIRGANGFGSTGS